MAPGVLPAAKGRVPHKSAGIKDSLEGASLHRRHAEPIAITAFHSYKVMRREGQLRDSDSSPPGLSAGASLSQIPVKYQRPEASAC